MNQFVRAVSNLLFPNETIESYSQLGQDLLALHLFGRDGFFVEFGAANGIDLSNTYTLEKNYNWRGIVSDPNKSYKDLLNRRNCSIDHRCVYTVSGEQVRFSEVENELELSTISKYCQNDSHKDIRKFNKEYLVETVSLDDLLNDHSAPQTIQYMSIDTEGSELDILNSFSFDWDIKLFTIEHNFNDNSHAILNLMSDKGYVAILPELSQWDFWFLKENLIEGN